MKKFASLLVIFTLLLPLNVTAEPVISGEAKGLILIEISTGEVLFEKNSHEKLEPASVTKVMTLLLIMEALDSGVITLKDQVSVSANAASMGGSQVFLKENETMTVDEMLKAISVASGNDASVAMAEFIAGSEDSFVSKMNEKASLLGMLDTNFANCTGLPHENHYSSAHDIAIMSRELILNHPDIAKYTTIWLDTLRNGAFQLANTNKLIYYYDGATGLKTGSTDNAGYCLSASAKRDNMELIAVILGSDTSAHRFETAKSLLNFGFSKYQVINIKETITIPPVFVNLGNLDSILPAPNGDCTLLLEKQNTQEIRTSVTLPDALDAPISSGDILGEIDVYSGDELVKTIDLVAESDVLRKNFTEIYHDFIYHLLSISDKL